MSRLFRCQGAYATTPYWIDKSGLSLYSIEELCYYIKENVVLLEPDFMCPDLATWIEKECDLQELGKELAANIRQKVEFPLFMKRLLQYVHYYSNEEIEEIVQQIHENGEMNTWEKKKARIDFYVKNGKYFVALRAYENMKRELFDSEKSLSARISNNIATIYAHLYYFDMAAKNYWQAYQEEPLDEYYFSYLAAKRMQLSEKQYIDFAAQETQNYEISLQLEKKLESLNNLWSESEEKKKLDELKDMHNGTHTGDYYGEIDQLSNQWKDTYRNYISK